MFHPTTTRDGSCLATSASLKLLRHHPDPSGRDYFFSVATVHLPLLVGTLGNIGCTYIIAFNAKTSVNLGL